MKDPELRTPAEWAAMLSRKRASVFNGELVAAIFSATDCRELADRMDDLTEALRLLRDEPHTSEVRDVQQSWNNRVDALLAKYQED